MNYKQRFYEISKPFFEEGLLKEIYSNDKVSICNLVNHRYVIFFYEMLKQGQKDFPGIMFKGHRLEATVDDPKYLLECYRMSSKETQIALLYPLNDFNFTRTQEVKKIMGKQGPDPSMRPDIEERILRKEKSRKNHICT